MTAPWWFERDLLKEIKEALREQERRRDNNDNIEVVDMSGRRYTLNGDDIV